MPEDALKKLLVRLNLDTSSFKSTIQNIKGQLKEVNEQAKKDAAALTAEGKKHNVAVLQQINDQKRLQAEARTLLAVDQARGQWEKTQQEHITTKIKAKALETAEVKKQYVEEQKLAAQERQRLAIAKEQLKVKQQEVNLFNAGSLKAKVHFEPFKPPTSGQTVQEQALYLNGEKTRLLMLDKQVQALEMQGKFRKVDSEHVRSLIGAERAIAEATEAGVNREKVRLAYLDKQAIAAARVASITDVEQLKRKIGLASSTPAKVGGITGVGGLLGPTASSVLAETSEHKRLLAVQEQELKVIASQGQFRKVDVAEVQKSIVAERQKLTLLEMQVKEQKEQSLIGRISSRVGESTGAIGGVIQRALGGGLFGGVAGGVFTGFVGAEVFSGLIENIHKLGEALVEETGVSRQMRLEFERLATMRGIAPTQMLEDLRKSTRGLVADTDLFKMANNFLRSGMKVTNDQVLELISNTLNLGRSMGKSTDQTTHALELAFLNPQRGMMTLARQTGIQVQVLRQAIAGLPNTLDPTVKATIMFNHILAEEEKMLKRVGVPVTTLPELFMQLRNAQRNFIDDMAQGALDTNSLEGSIKKLSQLLIDHQGDLEKWARSIGKDLSDGIKWTIDHATELKRIFEGFLALKLLNFVVNLTGGFNAWGKAIGYVVTKMAELKVAQAASGALGKTGGKVVTTVEGAIGTSIASLVPIVTGVLAALGLEWLLERKEKSEYAEGASKVVVGHTRGMPIYGPGYTPEQQAARQQLDQFVGGTKRPSGFANVPAKQAPTPEDEEANAIRDRKRAEQRAQIAQLMDELILEKDKQRIAAQEDLLKNQYDEGIISLRSYVAKEIALKDDEFKAEKARLNADTKANLDKVKIHTVATIDGNQYEIEDAQIAANLRTIVLEKEKVKETEIETKHDKEIYELRHQQIHDEQAAYSTLQGELAKIAQEGVEDRRKALESEFKEGFVGADAYVAQRKTLIQDELTATLQGLQIRKDAAKDNEDETAKIYIEEVEARRKADNEIIDIDLHRDEIRLQNLQQHYGKAKQYIELEATIAKSARPGTEVQDQFAINSILLSTTTQYISELEKQREPLQAGTTAWTNITEQIAQATQEQQKLNIELIEAKNTALPLSGLFGSLAGLIGNFRGTGAKAVSETFSTLQSSFEQIGQFSNFIQKQRMPKAPLDVEAIRANALKMFDQGLVGSVHVIDAHTKAMLEDTAAVSARAEQDNPWRTQGKPLDANQAPMRSAGFSTDPFDLPLQFAAGGIVPGVGPQLITAHGGETVINSQMTNIIHQFVAALKDAISSIEQLANKAKTSLVPPKPEPLLGPGVRPEGSPIPLPVLGIGPPAEQGKPSSAIGPPQDSLSLLMAPAKNLANSFEALFKSSGDASQGTKSFGSKLNDFVGQMQGWISGISGLIKTVTSGKTGAQGAIGGGMAGMQFGSTFGPIGAVAGLAGGAALGGIFGAKEKSLQQDIHKIQDQMQSIVDSMNEGAITLGTAIQDLRNERQQAIQMLSGNPKGGKGGGKGGKKGFQPSQAQAVIDQIDSQIAQLVNTQQQLLSQLDQQVATLANPQPFQQYVSSLDQIVQQYQQYMSAAAGSTQAMGNAQTFLNESLQTYVTTLGQQLNQAQQSAIQQGLSLLNLEYQRQQIINQEAQQEYDILTQGVLTRQRTTAMTKGQQIGEIQYQANMQLTQIDEQIALAQFQVQSAQQIFDLATTRVGLETQLLSLQEAQSDQQSQQTAALLQVIQGLQGAMASGSLMNSISALGSTPTGTSLLTTIMGTLGLGGNVPTSVLTGTGGATNYLSQLPQQYQSITNFINNLDPNFLQDLWSAMQTPAGSAQRQSVLQEAQPYGDDANTSGYDFNSFAQWIQSGAPIAASTATVTNSPVATGPQGLPTGTGFATPTAPGTAPSSIPGYSGTGGQTPYQSVSSGYNPTTDTLDSSMSSLNTSTQSVSTSMATLAENLTAVNQGITSGYNTAQAGAAGTPGGPGGPSRLPFGPVARPVMQRFQTGGPVMTTGPAIVEQGEWVLPQPVVQFMNAMGGVQNFINSIMGTSNTGGPGGPGGEGSIVSPGMPTGTPATPVMGGGQQIDVQSQLLDMTTQRTTMEMNVVSARQTQLQLESQYLAALNDTMTQIAATTSSNPGGPASSLESLFQQAFQTRGRYGSGNFRREQM